MRKIILGGILAVAAILLGLSMAVYATGEVFPTASNKTGYINVQIPINDLKIDGTGNDNVSLDLFVPSGSLSFSGNVSTATVAVLNGGKNVTVSGSRSGVNTALELLQYRNSTPESVTVTARLGGGDGSVFFSENNHVYQVVTPASPVTWAQAKTAAEGKSYGGVSGYLATIISQSEHDFVRARISDSGWLGANDIASEGVWRWVTGPEAGTQFWQGGTAATGGRVITGQYANWNISEPNNSGNDEDCAEIYFPGTTQDGKWNDLNCSQTRPNYVVEYGAPGALPSVANTSFQITTNPLPKPSITQFTPSKDAKDVVLNPRITMKFNEPVTISNESGGFGVFKASDDSLVASWSGQDNVEDHFDGQGTDTLTFLDHLALDPFTEYYIKSNDATFYNTSYGQATTDISSSSVWHFTTGDGDSISASIEDAAPNNGDGNNDGIKDSLQANVSSFVNTVTGNYVTLAVNNGCNIRSSEMRKESDNANQDDTADYPYGLIDFTADCGTPGFAAAVEVYYHNLAGDGIVKKYHPGDNIYTNISGATISSLIIGGQSATKLSYNITDGSSDDADDSANGVIVDPAGLAIQSNSTGQGTLLSTGDNTIALSVIGVALIILGVTTFRYHREKVNL